MTRETLGVGVVGLGRMGAIHAENLAVRIPAAQLARLADEAADRARLTGEALGAAWSTSFMDLLDDDAVKAIVIATPTALHAGMTQLAAAAGKHIYCEKPLALDADATAQAVEAVRTAGVQLQIGFHRRFDPDVALLHDHIRNDELGDISLFKATFREMSPPPLLYLRECGGIFIDAVIHDLDLARWLVGEVTELSATTAHHPNGNASAVDGLSAALILGFANGALGLVDTTRLGGFGYEAAIEVVGSRATVRTGHAQVREHLESLAAGEITRQLHVDFRERFGEAYRRALSSFVDSILAERPVTPCGEDAIAALRLASAAAQSTVERRTVGPVPLPLTVL